MKIGELSRRTAVSVRSLRYYEEQGLLSPSRTPGGHRDYPDSAVDRVILVQQLFAAGLHSPRIVQLLPCMHAPEGDPMSGRPLSSRISSRQSVIESTSRSPTS
ncbi:MerR family transcriptional regulator [Tsukamurella sputi]|uniref:MerR family transcriptional regulator n=1 Tax=Tsukamurella sputi TaxID=2591848 RepID=UPI0027BB19E3|nr:MerR family transcriptional regulator [Tsukamurella sputi]